MLTFQFFPIPSLLTVPQKLLIPHSINISQMLQKDDYMTLMLNREIPMQIIFHQYINTTVPLRVYVYKWLINRTVYSVL